MSTATLIIILVIGAGVLFFGAKTLLKKRKPAEMPLVVGGMVVGYSEKQMDRAAAASIAGELETIRARVIHELIRIYGEKHEAAIAKLKLDTTYLKPAGWPSWPAHLLCVNPSMKKRYRSHVAEEIHNLFRIEMHGYPHYDNPINEEDHRRREEAQEVCRGF